MGSVGIRGKDGIVGKLAAGAGEQDLAPKQADRDRR